VYCWGQCIVLLLPIVRKKKKNSSSSRLKLLCQDCVLQPHLFLLTYTYIVSTCKSVCESLDSDVTMAEATAQDPATILGGSRTLDAPQLEAALLHLEQLQYQVPVPFQLSSQIVLMLW